MTFNWNYFRKRYVFPFMVIELKFRVILIEISFVFQLYKPYCTIRDHIVPYYTILYHIRPYQTISFIYCTNNIICLLISNTLLPTIHINMHAFIIGYVNLLCRWYLYLLHCKYFKQYYYDKWNFKVKAH